MNQETANYIMQRMSKYLDNSQMIKLKHTLDESLRQSEDGGRKRVHRNFWICLLRQSGLREDQRKPCSYTALISKRCLRNPKRMSAL